MRVKRMMGEASPLGVSVCGKGIQFAFVSESNDCGVVLYDAKNGVELQRIAFPEEFVIGTVHTMCVFGIRVSEFMYLFYEGDKLVCDPFARKLCGNEEYGSISGIRERKALFSPLTYDWEQDKNPGLSYEDSFVYLLHVRGFTQHASSKVEAKGTFKGVEEKIPYLKELGVTTVEFQPLYDFDEVFVKSGCEESPYAKYASEEEKKVQFGRNYWGYAEGFYYAPKRSYAHTADSEKELKDMVKAFHANGMEVILQFYFPAGFEEWKVLDILRYWALEYHVDGFHIKGECRPMNLICGDPVLKKCKIWDYDFANDNRDTMVRSERRCGIYNDYYAQIIRRFAKGEDGLLGTVVERLRNQPLHAGVINYVTNYDGFTLMDLVSYDRKHNEENGEENRDGADYNFSWNCGVEGACRKKTVNALRVKQIKNFMSLLLLSQGTPLIFMGDEFGNSQGGNNNPYCLDNGTTWLDWNDLERNRELFDYLKALITLRKEHPILRCERQMRQMDYISCGYPDLSYHGEEAWKPNFEPYNHQMGIMLCGKYARIDRKTEDSTFYIGINMHWEPHEFALPNLPRDEKWIQCLYTEKEEEIILKDTKKGVLSPRSICVFMSVKDEKKQK